MGVQAFARTLARTGASGSARGLAPEKTGGPNGGFFAPAWWIGGGEGVDSHLLRKGRPRGRAWRDGSDQGAGRCVPGVVRGVRPRGRLGGDRGPGPPSAE